MQSIREDQIVIISWSNKEFNGLLEPLREKNQQLSTLLQNDNLRHIFDFSNVKAGQEIR